MRVWDLYRMRAVAAASLRALFASLQHLLALPATATATASASASAGAAGSNNRASSPRITRAKVCTYVRACVCAYTSIGLELTWFHVHIANN